MLGILGPLFTVIPAEIPEVPNKGEAPEKFVVRIAREKGLEVASRVTNSIVLSADTVVTIDGLILGKPADQKGAALMLKRLQGRQHQVYTAVCVIDQEKSQILEGMQRTSVWFNPMTDAQILDYVEREDVLDKAGAYAIQGYASVYIAKIEGNYTNVMGLPLPLVYELLKRLNVYF